MVCLKSEAYKGLWEVPVWDLTVSEHGSERARTSRPAACLAPSRQAERARWRVAHGVCAGGPSARAVPRHVLHGPWVARRCVQGAQG